MKEKIISIIRRFYPEQLSELASYLLKDEAISGKLILATTVLALLAANTALDSWYTNLLHTNLTVNLGEWALSKDFQHWIDEGLMAIFFLVVGLELKRELTRGELRRVKSAALPFAAAIGGMILPALIYFMLNRSGAGHDGWAIPMATDIAFAIGVLALLGKRIPSSARLFLLTLAIVDDIGAVTIIAIFYSSSIHLAMLAVVGLIVAVVLLLQKLRLLSMAVFVVAAIGIWLAVDASGIHPSIAGVLIGLLAPLTSYSQQRKPIAERLENIMIPVSTLVVVPIFAFANTGIHLSLKAITDASTLPIACGIILGLVLGKVLGILIASWLVVKLNFAELPSGVSWRHILGIGFLAGIGFTVAIFVTELAFESPDYITVAKISIFIASIISALVGLVVLQRRRAL